MQSSILRRLSYLALCLGPFVVVPMVVVRDLRVPGLYQVLGFLLAGSAVGCAWCVSRSPDARPGPRARQAKFAAWLLITPFVLMGLFWVGLGTPFDSTPTENHMRYAVLLASSVAITGGFVLLWEGLNDQGGEWAIIGLASGLLSGAAYAVWTSFQLGYYTVILSQGDVPPAIRVLNDVLDALLFAAGALAYLATGAFAYALSDANWFGRRAAWSYIIFNVAALILLMLRGVSFPSPNESVQPWYVQPAFVAGVPAVPWIMPFLLGVVTLRRAGANST